VIEELSQSVSQPLVDLARRVNAQFGDAVRIVERPHIGDDPGIRFIPVLTSAAALTVDFSVGVYFIFFENITKESTDFPDEVPQEWAFKIISSVAMNGVTERLEPWAWGLLRKNVIYLGDAPTIGKYAVVVRRLDSWLPA
jgi:hypothetical protein